MKIKIMAILMSGALALCIGVGIAYYNTRTFGFDENARVFSKDNEKITILDYELDYQIINDILDKAVNYLPDEHHTATL